MTPSEALAQISAILRADAEIPADMLHEVGDALAPAGLDPGDYGTEELGLTVLGDLSVIGQQIRAREGLLGAATVTERVGVITADYARIRVVYERHPHSTTHWRSRTEAREEAPAADPGPDPHCGGGDGCAVPGEPACSTPAEEAQRLQPPDAVAMLQRDEALGREQALEEAERADPREYPARHVPARLRRDGTPVGDPTCYLCLAPIHRGEVIRRSPGGSKRMHSACVIAVRFREADRVRALRPGRHYGEDFSSGDQEGAAVAERARLGGLSTGPPAQPDHHLDLGEPEEHWPEDDHYDECDDLDDDRCRRGSITRGEAS